MLEMRAGDTLNSFERSFIGSHPRTTLSVISNFWEVVNGPWPFNFLLVLRGVSYRKVSFSSFENLVFSLSWLFSIAVESLEI